MRLISTPMIKKLCASAAVLALSSAAFAAEWKIDENHTNARFAVDHFGTSTNMGAFTNITGVVTFDEATKQGFVGLTIPVSKLETGIEKFDEHLLSADFFDAAKYPSIFFNSTTWNTVVDPATGETRLMSIDGKLKIKGVERPVTLDVVRFNCYNSPMFKGSRVCGGDLSTNIKRSDYGIDKYSDVAAMDNVKLIIQVEAVKKDFYDDVWKPGQTNKPGTH